MRASFPTVTTARRTDVVNVGDHPMAAALNLTRDLFQSVPGVTIWEFDGTGLQANVGTRGLSPHRSGEFNVRQNGYDIASDPYGYPEAHYTPPTLALERINIVRGGGGIQFGTQFGGLLDYVVREPLPGPFNATVSMTGGSYGLFDAFGMASGTIDSSISYRSWLSFRRSDGWRENGSYNSGTAHAALFVPIGRGQLGVEVTGLWFVQRMPNGLTQAQYDANPSQSFRPRDWFAGPRIMPAVSFTMPLSSTTTWSTHISGLSGNRNSVTLATSTAIPDTGTNPRRVNVDAFANVILESRVAMRIGDHRIITGVRAGWTQTLRTQGQGDDGTEYTSEIIGAKSIDLDLQSFVASAFAEADVSIASSLHATVGVRIENLWSKAHGTYGASSTIDQSRFVAIPLFSAGVDYAASSEVHVYASAAQAYRPLLYSQQFPYDGIPVDSTIAPSKGLVCELGATGTLLRSPVNDRVLCGVNLSTFILYYGNRVAILHPDDLSYPTGIRTNAGSSLHYGAEAALYWYPVRSEDVGVTFRLTGSYTHAEYVSGKAEGNRVEFAPIVIARQSCVLSYGHLTASISVAYTGNAFTDASNTEIDPRGMVGLIPSYTLFDASLAYKVNTSSTLTLSVVNAANARYQTVRMTAYPGPGILPGDGRTVMLSAIVKL